MDDGRYGTDAQLVEGLRCKEEAAAEAFVERYLGLIKATVRGVLRSGVGDAAELEDATMVVTERLIRKATDINSPSRLRSFVARSARNEAIDWYRRQRRRLEREEGTESLEQLDGPDAVNDPRAPDYVLYKPKLANLFSKALESLDPKERRLLKDRADGIEYKEMEKLLPEDGKTVKEATWRKRHERALQKLRETCIALADGDPEILGALEETKEAAQSKRPRTSKEVS